MRGMFTPGYQHSSQALCLPVENVYSLTGQDIWNIFRCKNSGCRKGIKRWAEPLSLKIHAPTCLLFSMRKVDFKNGRTQEYPPDI